MGVEQRIDGSIRPNWWEVNYYIIQIQTGDSLSTCISQSKNEGVCVCVSCVYVRRVCVCLSLLLARKKKEEEKNGCLLLPALRAYN